MKHFNFSLRIWPKIIDINGKEKYFFRDYLLSHPEAAEKYQQLKIKLAQEHKYDREQYTDAKSEFINQILKLAQN